MGLHAVSKYELFALLDFLSALVVIFAALDDEVESQFKVFVAQFRHFVAQFDVDEVPNGVFAAQFGVFVSPNKVFVAQIGKLDSQFEVFVAQLGELGTQIADPGVNFSTCVRENINKHSVFTNLNKNHSKY